MYTPPPPEGPFVWLIERWRCFRGINQWLTVEGQVASRESVQGSEGGSYYRFVLTYQIEQQRAPTSIHAATLTDDNNTFDYIDVGDKIPLLVDPKDFDRATFADPTVAAERIWGLLFLGLFVGWILIMRACR